ncbi:hypothetical protein V6Z90_006465 [Aspergillus fumigatus]
MRQQEQPASWPHCESTAACDRWAWRDGWKSSTVISPHAAEATTTKMSMILAGTRKNRVLSVSQPCYPRRRRDHRFRSRIQTVTHKARRTCARLQRPPLCSFSVAVAMRFITLVLRHGGNIVRTGAQYVRHRTPRRNEIQISACFRSFLPSWLDFLGTAVSAYFAFVSGLSCKITISTAILTWHESGRQGRYRPANLTAFG